MQNRKYKPESDCGNYPDNEFDYHNPPIQPHYKVPKPHKIAYIRDWIVCLVVAGVIVTIILNAC